MADSFDIDIDINIDDDEPDGIVSTLHPEGSYNDIRDNNRELVRPDIDYTKTALHILVPVVVALLIGSWNAGIALVVLGCYTLVQSNVIAVWFIHLYQRCAPADTRLACVFVPSCSEYMILSIQKYGVIFGCFKGIRRLQRCHDLNGGEDYP